MKKTLLLVFIHGFKGGDQTFHNFPQDLRALLAHTLTNINVLSITYPQFDTRGDLKQCVASFKEWLQNKVIDLEVANEAHSPTLDPSVHVILCGHSMGGIVAAETLLSIARDEIIPPTYTDHPTNSTTPHSNVTAPSNQTSTQSSSTTRLFFPHVRGVLAFDTPYLGISPGVLAHGAEEQLQEASSAYKAYDTASKLFNWGTKPSTTAAATDAATASTVTNNPGAAAPTWGGAWGKYAMYGGAAAAVASVAGAAYMNWNQINAGLTWASSHLEFVGCLARGAELQARVEAVVALGRSHNVGFANFYGALHEKVTSKTRYAGMVLGQDRTFCVVPRSVRQAAVVAATGKDQAEVKAEAEMDAQMKQGKQVRDFAQDPTRSKGRWVKCVNQNVTDEVSSHVSMFAADTNPDYHSMVPRARDQISEWVDSAWYGGSIA